MQVAWYVGLGRAWFSRYSPSLSSYLALPPPPFRPWLYALVSAVMKNNDKLPTNQTSRSFRYVKLFRTFCAIKRTCTYFRSRKILNYYLTDCFFLPILYRFWKSIFVIFICTFFLPIFLPISKVEFQGHIFCYLSWNIDSCGGISYIDLWHVRQYCPEVFTAKRLNQNTALIYAIRRIRYNALP